MSVRDSAPSVARRIRPLRCATQPAWRGIAHGGLVGAVAPLDGHWFEPAEAALAGEAVVHLVDAGLVILVRRAAGALKTGEGDDAEPRLGPAFRRLFDGAGDAVLDEAV